MPPQDSKPKPKPKARINPFGSSVPLPEARELGDLTGWELWDQAMKRSQAQFAETAPLTSLHPPEGVDRRYAPTEPAAILSRPVPARQARSVTLDEVLTEARRRNRVCPRPIWWEELYARLPEWATQGATLPRPPLSGDSWDRTPALAKRMSFRDHVEWCDQERCLPQLLDFLKALPEEAWYRMGE